MGSIVEVLLISFTGTGDVSVESQHNSRPRHGLRPNDVNTNGSQSSVLMHRGVRGTGGILFRIEL